MAHKRLIVVLGMHRSGTSTLARALLTMGVSLGEKLMPGAQGDNPKGFFEDMDIYALNMEMLGVLKTDWFSLRPIEPSDVEVLKVRGYYMRAIELLQGKTAGVAVFAFKDPRVTKLLPFWQAVLAHCGLDVAFVVALRHPRSVALSLTERNGIDLERGYLLWLEHVTRIADMAREHPCVFVDYDILLGAPVAELARVARVLDLTLDPAALEEFTQEFLESGLRHSVFGHDDLIGDAACPPLVGEVYHFLLERARDSPADGQALDWSAGKAWAYEMERQKPTFAYLERLNAQVVQEQVQQEILRGEIETLRAQSVRHRQDLQALRLELEEQERRAVMALEQARGDLRTQLEVACGELLIAEKEKTALHSQAARREAEAAQLAEKMQRDSSELQLVWTQLARHQQEQFAAGTAALQGQLREATQQLLAADAAQARLLAQAAAELESSRDAAAAEQSRLRAETEALRLALTVEKTELALQLADARRRLALAQSGRETSRLQLRRIARGSPWRLPARLRDFLDFEEPATPVGLQAPGGVAPGVPPRAAASLGELLCQPDAVFVTSVYLTLLGRLPDAPGFAHYTDVLRRSGDRLSIVYQVFCSAEARQRRSKLPGLQVAMRHERRKRIPLLGPLWTVLDRDTPANIMRAMLRHADVWRADRAEQAGQVLFGARPFDDVGYLSVHEDVARSGMNAFEHYVRHGWREGRSLPKAAAVPVADAAVPLEPASGPDRVHKIVDYFMQPAAAALQDDGYTFSQLMYYIWSSRLDLQRAFDIGQRAQRIAYCEWFVVNASREYGLTPAVYPDSLLARLIADAGSAAAAARDLQRAKAAPGGAEAPSVTMPESAAAAGANLVGYAFGEFGMGEHVRMVARSLDTAAYPFCVIDQDVGLHGSGDASIAHWVTDTPAHGTNIFHVNADVFPPLYFKFGEAMFAGRYNVGYWAWELSRIPEQFDVALNMIDEVWAISDFVAESFKTRSPVPVVTMPLAVTVPALEPIYDKRYYGLPEDAFVFFFVFDAASYLDRKNPRAVLRAFRQAFPLGNEPVHLLLKTMNTEVAGSMWGDLLQEVAEDPRITVMGRRMTRLEVLGLNQACDAFVSLHRSEGFGRCVAEAMAYGIPVVVTDYSGTRDFAREGTACLVGYELVAVPEGAYPFWEGQVWAEPDVPQAAAHMRALVEDAAWREQIARAGQRYVLDHFNEAEVGRRYAQRLAEIDAERAVRSQPQPAAPSTNSAGDPDEFVFCLDSPSPAQSAAVSEVLAVEGWATARHGMASVRILLDGRDAGLAHHGILRQDVKDAFPTLVGAARSGFCNLLHLAGLEPGPHELTVRLSSGAGSTRDWTARFSVVRSRRYQDWLQHNARLHKAAPPPAASETGMRLSVIVDATAKNAPSLLAQSLRALSERTVGACEVIVVAEPGQRAGLAAQLVLAAASAKLRLAPDNCLSWFMAVPECTGELVTVMEAGDMLLPWTLADVARAYASQPAAGLLYGDEDQLRDGERTAPIFKPGWSPVFLAHYNYIGRPWFAPLGALREALSQIGEGGAAPDEHRLLAQLGRMAKQVCHLPDVLLSRRATQAQQGPAPVPVAAVQAVSYPKVSVIVPTCLSDLVLARQCFAGLGELTDYPELEVIVVANNIRDEDALQACRRKWPFRYLEWTGAFSWSGVNNLGAASATGDLLLFLNDDVVPTEKGWLKSLVDVLRNTGAGALGPLLLYPNGSIQHAGLYVPRSSQDLHHLFRFAPASTSESAWLLGAPREVSAVTGACLLTSRACFDALEGFDERLPLVCNDTDYCLRLRESGYATVLVPAVQLVHHEGVSRAGMSERDDVLVFRERWKAWLQAGDSFANPNLDPGRHDWVADPAFPALAPARSSARTGRKNPL